MVNAKWWSENEVCRVHADRVAMSKPMKEWRWCRRVEVLKLKHKKTSCSPLKKKGIMHRGV